LSGNDLAVANIEAIWIEVALPESTFPLVEHVDCFGLVCFHSGNRLREHGLGLLSRAALALLCERARREHEGRSRYRTDHERTHHWFPPLLPYSE
jgi:hypothetical protein